VAVFGYFRVTFDSRIDCLARDAGGCGEGSDGVRAGAEGLEGGEDCVIL
jgi:hypothetical protein